MPRLAFIKVKCQECGFRWAVSPRPLPCKCPCCEKLTVMPDSRRKPMGRGWYHWIREDREWIQSRRKGGVIQ